MTYTLDILIKNERRLPFFCTETPVPIPQVGESICDDTFGRLVVLQRDFTSQQTAEGEAIEVTVNLLCEKAE